MLLHLGLLNELFSTNWRTLFMKLSFFCTAKYRLESNKAGIFIHISLSFASLYRAKGFSSNFIELSTYQPSKYTRHYCCRRTKMSWIQYAFSALVLDCTFYGYNCQSFKLERIKGNLQYDEIFRKSFLNIWLYFIWSIKFDPLPSYFHNLRFAAFFSKFTSLKAH